MNKYKHNYLDPWYQSLLSLLVNENQSFSKSDRTGTGTRSLFGVQFRHDMSDGFPLLTTKKMAFKTMITELLWFLRGDTNIKYLVDNDCHIWDGDAYKNYLKLTSQVIPFTKEEFLNHIKTNDEFAKLWGELGPIYGKQWRSWGGIVRRGVEFDTETYVPTKFEDVRVHDQIANLINELKTNPDSRRLMVSAWNVGELDQMVLPPCHYGFQMYTRELSLEERFKIQMESMTYSGPMNFEEQYIKDVCDKHNIPTRAISLMWNQRSVDTLLGLPFNIASYGLLLEIIAKEVNMVPKQLIGNLGDVHLYNNHIEQAKEQITRTPYELPTIKIENEVVWKEYDCLPSYKVDDFTLENYQSHPAIKAPLSN